MDSAARGKLALEASDFPAAIEAYTAALTKSPTSPDYYIQRSTAHLRNKQPLEALSDAEIAVVNAQKRAKRELIIEAQFRRGCALYNVERYGDAEFVFKLVLSMKKDHKACGVWMSKTTSSLARLEDGDAKKNCTVMETPELQESPGILASSSPVSYSSGPLTTQTVANAKEDSSSRLHTGPAAPQQTPADKIRHEWYQNSQNIFFTLLVKGAPKDAKVTVTPRSLNISFPLLNASSYDLTLEPLWGEVKEKETNTRILSTKIEVVLVKEQPGQKWASLETSEPISQSHPPDVLDAKSNALKRAVFATESKPAGPAYPTSSKTGPKDWDKMFDKDDEEEIVGDEANHFFKKLYKHATPEAQRAMMKSYVESDGTALSTNWDEVSKGKVETLPPDGMEAKKWNS